MQAIFKPPKAMRGGIQLCFPQVLSVTWNIYINWCLLLQPINFFTHPWSLGTADHWNNMALRGIGCGALTRTLLLWTSMMAMTKFLWTCCLNHQKMIWSVGHTSMTPCWHHIVAFLHVLSNLHAAKKISTFYFSYEFRLRVSLSMAGDLTLISRIRNINGKPFSFSYAYHSYFSVSDIR